MIKCRTITCDDAIKEIAETLNQTEGDFITDIFNQVCRGKASYDEYDHVINIEEEE